MKKRISLDSTIKYSLDKVSCFERAVANQLNHKNGYYGDLFIILSKIYQFYFLQIGVDSREKIIELSKRLLNLEIKHIHKNNFSKNIQNYINKGYVTVLGGNLISLFYSEQYMEKDWPHWFIITGYDTDKKLYYVIDDIQYAHEDKVYGDVCLTSKMLKSIYRKYISKYGIKWSCFVLDVQYELFLSEALRKILMLYFEFDISDSTAYPQLLLLSELSKLAQCNNITNKALFEEVKKKILNMNKCRSVFIQEIEKYMNYLEFNNGLIGFLHEYNINLEKLWNSFVTSNILKIITYKETDIKIPDEIIGLEKKISFLLRSFVNFLSLTNIKNLEKKDDIYERCDRDLYIENDENKIIDLYDREILFEFISGKTYNWWFEDNAPKIVLASKINSNQNFKLSTKIKVDKGYTQKNFQAGIFLRSNKISLFAAMDSNGIFVLDEIGKLNQSKYFDFSNEFNISVEKNNNIILAKISNLDSEKSEIKWYLDDGEDIDVGLACKTWESFGKVNIRFYDYYITLN